MANIYLNDIVFHHRIIGMGPTLVLLHGWGADNTMYEEQIGELSKHFELILYDHRGHGRSSKSRDKAKYTTEQFSDDLKILLDSLSRKRVHLLGHSMGGNIALSFAIKYPESVKKLILASTFAERRMSFSEKVQLQIAKFLPLRLIAAPFARSCLAVPNKELIKRQVNYFVNAGKDTLLNSAKSIGAVDFTNKLHLVSAETLIIHGEHDKAVPFENAEKLNNGIRNSRIAVIHGGGHATIWENKEEFNSIVHNFLK